jgi:hypothetical protein
MDLTFKDLFENEKTIFDPVAWASFTGYATYRIYLEIVRDSCRAEDNVAVSAMPNSHFQLCNHSIYFFPLVKFQLK